MKKLIATVIILGFAANADQIADTAQPGAAAAAAEAQPDVIKKGKEEAAGDAKKAEEKK